MNRVSRFGEFNRLPSPVCSHAPSRRHRIAAAPPATLAAGKATLRQPPGLPIFRCSFTFFSRADPNFLRRKHLESFSGADAADKGSQALDFVTQNQKYSMAILDMIKSQHVFHRSWEEVRSSRNQSFSR